MDSATVDFAGTPSQSYAQGVAAREWQDDPAQRAALGEFDRLREQLLAAHGDWWSRFRGRTAPEGIYLWGAVGRGKTMLMDLFAQSLPPGMVQRAHFHAFMLDVHARLRRLGGHRDPLREVAAQLAEHARVLCLDEFMVQDIGDAMILGNLLRAMFHRGVALVSTSNTAPQDLYRGGLQRARFEPAIALIERHCRVLQLVSPHDWRLRALTRERVYLTPPGPQAERMLAALFDNLAGGPVQQGGVLRINDRDIPVRRACAQAAWFDFAALCEGPRSSADYIELAREFPAILISEVPQFTPLGEDAARRFVQLIDELYDRRVKLALSAATPAVELYDGRRLRAEFARTASRLVEMQSTAYLAEAHR
ncbi:MAG TPA: cell division protein ZapE [Rhodanobacteraceae bacterium]|nr:cell division protein ZapE [Rhodanobacteraceae bacterium]